MFNVGKIVALSSTILTQYCEYMYYSNATFYMVVLLPMYDESCIKLYNRYLFHQLKSVDISRVLQWVYFCSV